MIVIDASITAAWYFEDEQAAAALVTLSRVAEQGAIVPQLWKIEIANVFQMGVRRRRMSASYRDECLLKLSDLPIVVDTLTGVHAWSATLELSDRYGLTTYDASYLELAVRLKLPLATLDRELVVAARASGLEALP